jgi:hypothetical protein
MGNRGTNHTKYGKAHRVDGSCCGRVIGSN